MSDKSTPNVFAEALEETPSGIDSLESAANNGSEDWETRYKNLRSSRDERIAKYEQELETLREQLEKSTPDPKVKEGLFESDLDSYVPGWRTTVRSSAFKQWLNEPDPFTGQSRKDVLSNAAQQLDARTTANIIKSYLSNGASDDVQEAPAPGRRPQQTNPQGGEQIIPRQAIINFQNKKEQLVREGRFVGKVVEEYAAVERQIQQALQEGRVK